MKGNLLVATSTASASTTNARWSRQHDVSPTLASPLLRQLCANWTTLNASVEACSTVAEWADAHDCLAGLDTPGQVIEHIAASGRAVKDQVLRVLLSLVRDGDRLAGQVLLHTMLPLLAKMPKSIRAPRGEDGYEQVLQRVLADFWEVIVAGPEPTRPDVAGRLRMDTLNRVTSHRRSRDVWEDHVCYCEAGEPASNIAMTGTHATGYNSAGEDGDLNPHGDLASVLLWMRDRGDFTAEEARFFGEVYLVSDGDQKAAAERLGLSHAATRQRISRLRNRLCAAVAAEISGRADTALARAS
jgi:hypothetical protein